MLKIFVLFTLIGISFNSVSQTINCVAFDNGSSYPSINANLPYTVHSGTTVRIQNLNGNGVLTNRGTLRKTNLSSNITEFINYGILYLDGTIETKVYNYGTIIVSNNLNIQNNGYIVNSENGTMCVSGNIVINNGSSIYNNGNFKATTNIHLNGGAYFSNNNNGNVEIGSVSVDGGSTFCNSSNGSTSVNSSITITNGGAFSSCGGIFQHGGTVNNQNNNGTFFVNPGSCTSSCITVLAISLSEFSGSNKTDGNIIYWKTLNDRNTNYYLLEHSTDGLKWEIIKNEPVKNEISNEYSYTHKNFLSGANYYRLTQVGIEGNSEVSEIIYINNIAKRVTGRVNLIGQPVDEYYRGIIIIQYEDGSTEKVFHF